MATGVIRDGWWNLHCRLTLTKPPGFDPGPGIADDPFYRFLQRTWMAQQLPVALTPLDEGRTEISLRIDYRRNLDPAWYFHPLQQFAMGKMVEFFIEQVMVRG